MKVLIYTTILLFSSFQDEIVRDIGTAIKSGSAKELAKFCNKVIEIKIDGKRANYSRFQAEIVLRKFFSKTPPTNFTYIHQGASPEGLKYTIGSYVSEQGTYRVVMVIKKNGDRYFIDTLNFNQE